MRAAAIEGFHSGYDRLKKTPTTTSTSSKWWSQPRSRAPPPRRSSPTTMSDLAKIDDWDTAEQLQWTHYSEVTDFDPSLAPLTW
nr:hypothetical protein [Angustibacter aerolatus]